MNLNIIHGGGHIDERGEVQFVNDFSFPDVKRFYIIKPKQNQVRAWQGHKIERKYFFASHGSFLVCTILIDNWDKPSTDLEVNQIILNSNDHKILEIPAGYANGFKALEPNSTLIVFSNLTLAESQQDDYRFDQSLWVDWEDI